MKKYVIIAAAAMFVVGCKDVKKNEQEVVAKDSLSLPKNETADEAAGASGTAKIDASVALKFINDYVAQQDKLNGIEAIGAWVAANPDVTERYITAVRQEINDINNEPETILDSDIILDSQDYDDAYVVVRTDESKGYVYLEGEKHKEFKVIVKLVQQNGKWLVDDCGDLAE